MTFNEESYREVLRRYWGYEDFRGIQLDIIKSIGDGKDTLGLMPTGGGKSVTFQVPAMTMAGTCLVITPLIALMKDQVKKLRQLGIKATALYSGQSRQDNLTAIDNCILGGYKFLYVSPERLSSELFLTKIHHLTVSFITVDEAHCISQWGYDFRPSYMQIAEIRKAIPQVPVLALTATATSDVIKDIQKQLGFRQENVFRMSFERKNLAYTIYRADEKSKAIRYILDRIPGSSIIYTRDRAECQEISEELNKKGYKATFYHAGVPHSIRDERQIRWQKDDIRIMVATNAFGMGIDKPDVRTVIHTDLPDSLEEYFQEAGRAGRDGNKSYAVMVVDGKEIDRTKQRVSRNYPKEEYIRELYEKLCDYLHLAMGDGLNVTREFNIGEFCRTFRFHPVMTHNALLLLEKTGLIEYTDAEEGQSRLRIIATRNELYRLVNGMEERVVNAMFRHYGGIFATYVYIDEQLICQETGLDTDTVYHILTGLNSRNILDYIPRKHIPMITFRQKRIAKEKIVFSQEIYKQRKEIYEWRLRAIQEYCANTVECRSSILLKYFGETPTHNCGICDVCQRQKASTPTRQEYDQIRSHIINRLKNGPVRAYDLNMPGISQDSFMQVLSAMRSNEEITMADNLLIKLTDT